MLWKTNIFVQKRVENHIDLVQQIKLLNEGKYLHEDACWQ
jgi:hypothetical protein